MTAADLLPPRKSSVWTRSLAAAMTDELPVPIREALDPAAAPAPFMPWLAVHYGARLWFPDWTLARKRQVIGEAELAAWEVGTRAGATRFLGYVDAQLVDAVAYPVPFVMGRAVIGRTPHGHPPFLARYLVRVETFKPPRATVIGRSVTGRARLKAPDLEPLRRCLVALRAAKAPETEIRVDFAHQRPLTIADAPPLDGSTHLDAFVTRTKL